MKAARWEKDIPALTHLCIVQGCVVFPYVFPGHVIQTDVVLWRCFIAQAGCCLAPDIARQLYGNCRRVHHGYQYQRTLLALRAQTDIFSILLQHTQGYRYSYNGWKRLQIHCFSHRIEPFYFSMILQQTIVPDLYKASWQKMQLKTAQELLLA